MVKILIVVFLGLTDVIATPCKNKKLESKLDDGLRYQYVKGADGKHHLTDLWTRTSDLKEAARYNADAMNAYHLFTRENPSLSQLIMFKNDDWLRTTNYNSSRRTILLIHGWLDTVTADFNTALVPGQAVAKFITWLNNASGSELKNYHLLGHSLGAHQAGIVGRILGGQIGYITALDAAFPGWVTNDDKFKSTDGIYTEVIHTNAGLLGYPEPLGNVDFYPNGGIDMPGCFSQECDHNRSIFYFAESITAGGFTGTRCYSYAAAMAGKCFLDETMNMGGLTPKFGKTGIFFLRTNTYPPFSRGLKDIPNKL